MGEDIKIKLEKIADIWNNFIWKYSYCKKQLKFDFESETNYFGDILGYFQDTNEIIFNYLNSTNNDQILSNQISLFQSIYVQQDFIEELLRLFKVKENNTHLNKSHLKDDVNYSINRNIRNELIGHPIRRENNNGKLTSSCLFGYNDDYKKISYLKYHKDNNFKFESIELSIQDIISRHEIFLSTYLDKILNKLKTILLKFNKEINHLEKLINTLTFDKKLNLIDVSFESIFNYDYIYDKETLLKVYLLKDKHIRYQNVINQFQIDLKSDLNETKKYISDLLNGDSSNIIENDFNKTSISDFFDKKRVQLYTSKNELINYNYELEKLANKRNSEDFNFFGDILRKKCLNNKLVIQELEHMESNIHNELEYYSAYKLIYKELKQ